VAWHESGVAVSGKFGPLGYRAGVVNGLDSTGFSSGGWVREGHQTRFEQANAEDLAVFAQLDWSVFPGLTLGTAAYQGNSTNNRPKADLDADAVVTIVEVDGVYAIDPLTVRTQYMAGTLTNSDSVSTANKNLSNNLNVKRTAVAKEARAAFVEAGFDLFWLSSGRADGGNTRLDVFVRYDEYDTMAAVEGSVADNEFWDRDTITVGVNYRPIPNLVVKAHHSERTAASGLTESGDHSESTTVLGMGIDY
jgi:hypothetical protein